MWKSGTADPGYFEQDIDSCVGTSVASVIYKENITFSSRPNRVAVFVSQHTSDQITQN